MNNNILLTILSVSVSGSVLSLLMFLLKPLIKNRVSKAFSYYIWILVLLRLVLPFGYNVNILEMPQLFTDAGVQSYTIPAEDVQVSTDKIPNTVGQTENQSDDNANIAASGDNSADSGNESLPTTANTPATSNRFDLWRLVRANLFFIWLAGAIVSLCWYAIAYTMFSRKLSCSFEVPQDDDLKAFKKIIKGEKVRLACSGRINTPMLIGVLRPVVVLPQLAYMANGMGSEFYGILRHELTHYQRHDIVYKWLVVFVTSLHWFNPLVYLIRREIADACELSCDEAVIENMSISERKGYGNTLLALATKQRIPAGVMATTLCEGKKQLKGRLMSIMNCKKTTHSAIALMIILALALTGCAAGIAGISPLPGEQTDNPEELNQPSANPVETSVTPSPNDNQEPTQPSASSITSAAEFSKPGVYEITYNITYTFQINDSANASICIKGTENADGDECITLVVDGAENNAMEISEDKMKAYIIRNDNGNVGVLVSGEGNGDSKYNTYIYGFDGNKPILKAGCGYETVSLTTKSITLQGTRDVFGTWVISNDGTLNDDFSIEYSNNRYFTVDSIGMSIVSRTENLEC